MMPGFDSPKILFFLLALPLIYYLYRRAIATRKMAAIRFSNLGLIKSALGQGREAKSAAIMFHLSFAAIALMMIGFANPTIPLGQTKEGVNVVLIIDVSGSMQAQDYKPSRLEAAKKSGEILIKSLLPKDYAGVVIFESGATTVAYLSPYKDRVIERLRSIAPHQGATAIGDGLSMGIDMAVSNPNRKKVVILLSDGGNNAGVITPAEAIEYAKSNGIQVYTVGVGTQGHTVLGHDFFGNPEYADLDEDALKDIATKTGGKYFRSVDEGTLSDIYKNINQEIKREKEPTNIKDWFFLAATILLLIYLYLRFGSRRIIQ